MTQPQVDTPFLQLRNLRKSYGHHTIVDIEDLTLERGEIFSILGPSGCGKTTLLRLIAGLEQPDVGQIILNGVDITTLPPHRRQVNTVFQNYALFPHMSVWENIAFGLHIRKVSEETISKAVKQVLELTQMSEHAFKQPESLSGGQKQRVAIARALVLRPQILLLDEPLAALDLKLRQRMLLELDLLHDEVDINFIFITHDQEEAMSISDRIAVMQCGKIEQIGTPQEIYENPKTQFIANFIGETNTFTGTFQFCDKLSHELLKQLPESANSSQEDITQPVEHFFKGALTTECSQNPLKVNASQEFTLNLLVGDAFPSQLRASLCVRPEKIRIARAHHSAYAGDHNYLLGVVEDIIYLGHQTKYWVRCGQARVQVLRSHTHQYLEEEIIVWDDKVTLAWQVSDGFLLPCKDEGITPMTDDSAPCEISDEATYAS